LRLFLSPSAYLLARSKSKSGGVLLFPAGLQLHLALGRARLSPAAYCFLIRAELKNRRNGGLVGRFQVSLFFFFIKFTALWLLLPNGGVRKVS
jgi:hypothetical protein